MTTYWVSMTLCDNQMRPRQNRVIAWDGPGSKTKGAKKNGKLSYWGEGRRRPAGRSLEKCLLCHRSTINYSNLQMAFNVGWNRKGLSFVRVFALIGPTRFPMPCTQQLGASVRKPGIPTFDDFGAISVTERSCAAPVSKVESHILDRCLHFSSIRNYPMLEV